MCLLFQVALFPGVAQLLVVWLLRKFMSFIKVVKGVNTQHACFVCRKVFKRAEEYRPLGKHGVRPPRTVRKCPHCGGNTVHMGPKFRAPKMSDGVEWSRIEQCLKDGWDYGIPTVRKVKPKPKLDPALRIALGIYGKRRAKTT